MSEYDKECNNKVKLCQNCYFFEHLIFDHEEEYYWDEEVGVFTLWVWEGYCENPLNPAEFPYFHHQTKSDRKCEYFITEEEMKELRKRVKNKNEIDTMEYVLTLREIRGEV
jgi:hypothetical protein